jgi:hypothetical protein
MEMRAIFSDGQMLPFFRITDYDEQVGLKGATGKSAPTEKCENSETKRRLSS